MLTTSQSEAKLGRADRWIWWKSISEAGLGKSNLIVVGNHHRRRTGEAKDR